MGSAARSVEMGRVLAELAAMFGGEAPAFLTVQEIAQFLRVSYRTALHWVLDGDLPHMRSVKGRVLVLTDDLLCHLERQQIGAGESEREHASAAAR